MTRDDRFSFDDHSSLVWCCLKSGWGWALFQLKRGNSKARAHFDKMSDDIRTNGPLSFRTPPEPDDDYADRAEWKARR